MVEIYSNGEWLPGPDLPAPLVLHCQGCHVLHHSCSMSRLSTPSPSRFAQNDRRQQAGQVQLGNLTLVIGGTDSWTQAWYLVAGAGSWTRLPDLIQGRTRHACAVLGDRVYVVGGKSGGSLRYRTEIFSFAAGEWR